MDRAEKKRIEKEVEAAQQAYRDIANQQLSNIASGDEFNPWLSLQRHFIEQAQLKRAEQQLPGTPWGFSTPASQARTEQWERALEAAREWREKHKASAAGRKLPEFIP